ncbi:LysE family transporter [Pseudomonas moraviensis]|jgi:threonine/homoserine/homoserine lactone efflux protein|uniref:LysE family translocator n=1 Tax=Pseudomonas TaxID=286 RepID=UPI000F02A339|nr:MULTISPECIES: LysE family translocator [Pseudomonas]MXI46095.1 LysE family transporter [Pseudomonas moraviensis]WLG64156.1 LysE family translocator [Pseudomonas sp. FP1762]
MPLTEYVLFTLIAVSQIGFPKPSKIFLVNHALVHSPNRDMLILSGDVLATTVVAACSLLGINSLLWAHPDALKIMQFTGAVYILWLSLKQLRKKSSSQNNGAQHVIYGRTSVLWVRSFIAGISNPNTVLLFLSLLPQFIESAQEINNEALFLMTLIFVFCKFLLSSTYTLTSKKMKKWLDESHVLLWSKRALGSVTMFFGLVMGFHAFD